MLDLFHYVFSGEESSVQKVSDHVLPRTRLSGTENWFKLVFEFCRIRLAETGDPPNTKMKLDLI